MFVQFGFHKIMTKFSGMSVTLNKTEIKA